MIGFPFRKGFAIYYFSAVILLYFLAGFFSCKQPADKYTEAGMGISEKVDILDFGKVLFALDPWSLKTGLDSISGDYSFFIGKNPDTLKIIQLREFITDPFNRELAEKCEEKYPDHEFLAEELSLAFAHATFYFPEFRSPMVFTYVSGLLYEYPVQYADSVLIIALDMFLGWDYEPYRAAGIPVYLSRRMESPNITPEVCRQIALSNLPNNLSLKSLLDHMILHGKVLYALDMLLPETSDHLKIGYTPDQLKWCKQNERLLWRLYIDQEILFSNDSHAKTRFIQDGPFTAGLPEGAPAMLGRWTGWQIVRSFMKKNPEYNLVQLLQMEDSGLILSKSGYKPRK